MTAAPSRVNLGLSWPVPASPQEQAWTTRASAAVAASRLQVRFMPIPPLPAGGRNCPPPNFFQEGQAWISSRGNQRGNSIELAPSRLVALRDLGNRWDGSGQAM